MCPPLEESRRSIGAILEAGAQGDPHRIILQQGRVRLSYRQLHDTILRAAAHLRAAGIEPGDPVALLFQNTPACAIAFLALAWLDAGLIPLEADTAAPGLESLREETEFTTIVGHAAKLRPLEQSLRRHAGTCIEVESLPVRPGVAPSGVRPKPTAPDQPFVYHYTSGSTGPPKAALHSQSNLVNGGLIYQRTYGIGPEDSILTAVPLLHSFGMVAGLVTALLTGARLLLCERFIPRQLLRALADEQATILLGVPLMYDLMARAHPIGTLQLSQLRLCLSSGGALTPDVAERFHSHYGKAIYQVYGSTEAGIIAAQRPEDPPGSHGAVGRPVTGVQTRIVDDHGRPLPPGAAGNLLVRTPAMFGGYFRQPEATAKAFQDGWYATGDVARQDEDGLLYLAGRKDTFINVGGKKVNPLEVEGALLSHPSVKEAVVWGASVGSAGEHVRAAVVTAGPLTAAELLAFCRERLLPYQVPVGIDFVAALPKTTLGKIRRSEIGVAIDSPTAPEEDVARP